MIKERFSHYPRSWLTRGAFHSTKNSGPSETAAKWYENVLGKFLESPKIAKFPKGEPFNRKCRKSREENQMEQKLRDTNFRKIRYTSLDCPLFQEFWKMLFLSPLEMSGNANRNFWSDRMRTRTPLYIS